MSISIITFALPEESRDLIRGLGFSGRGEASGLVGGREWVVAHVGVGPESARRRMAELLEHYRPERVVSAGYAGGLDPKLAVGDLLWVTNFSDGEWLRAVGGLEARPRTFAGAMTTQDTVIESAAEKARLAGQTGALAVDMETAVVAEACQKAGVPLLALRVISDCAGDDLPVPMAHWFDLNRQRPRPLGLVAYLVRHPSRILPFARFVSGLGPARRALTARLIEALGASPP